MTPALIIIDLQNDFLSLEGAMGNKVIQFDDALLTLKDVCGTFKAQGFPIVFIRSEYFTNESGVKDPERPVRYVARPPGDKYRYVPSNDEYLSSTCQSAICQPGTKGAEFTDAVKSLADNYASKIITKHWHSSFTETDLHEWLQQQNVADGPLYFAGVTANTCVMATLTDGFFLGYQVIAIRECIAAFRQKTLQEAIKKIETYYGHVGSAAEVLKVTKDPTTWSSHPRRTLYFVNGSIPSWRVMMVLAHKKLPYTARRLKVMTNPRETRQPEFEALNTRCKTPVLIDEDGTVMIESQAILQYLETYYPGDGDGALMPTKDHKKDYAIKLQAFHESENLHYVFEDIELLFLEDKAPETLRKVQDAYENTIKELKHWECKVSETEYVAGDEFSLADCALYPCLAYMVHRGLDLRGEGFPKLDKYYGNVYEKRCAKEACPEGWAVPRKNLFSMAKKLGAEESAKGDT